MFEIKQEFDLKDKKNRTKENLVPELQTNITEEKLLEFDNVNLKRCTKCIFPETMPYIQFDESGVCNYCRNYKPRNKPKPKEELMRLN